MPTDIGLFKWTEQGVRNVKDMVTGVEQARGTVEKAGGRLIGTWWTQGTYDIVAVAEYPDDETASAVTLSVAMAANVRTETMRAYTAEEMLRIIQKLP